MCAVLQIHANFIQKKKIPIILRVIQNNLVFPIILINC